MSLPERGRSLPSRRRAAVLGGSVLGATVLFAPGVADAASFVVTDAGDAGPGTLRQEITDANASAGADTITFRADITGTIDLASPLPASTGPLTIDGTGHILDAHGTGHVLAVSADTTVENLTLTGGTDSGVYAYGSAPAITLVLDHVTVTGNRGTTGGAVQASGDTVQVTDSTISTNTATGQGGGIFVSGGSLSIENSLITGNTASGASGGAVYANAAALTITGSQITANSASNPAARGGAISVNAPTQTTRIEDSQITGNSTVGKGGALAVKTGTGALEIVDSTITGNSATGRGGALFLYRVGGQTTIEGSHIDQNTTQNRGAGLFLYNLFADLDITDSSIDDNHAPSGTGNGGGIFFYKASAGVTVSVEDSSVSDNDAARAGGGIYFYKGSGHLDLINATVAGNSAGTTGGGIFDRGPFGGTAQLNLTSVTVAGNTASVSGGGLSVTAVPTTLHNTIVADNSAPSGPDGTTGGANVSADFSLFENLSGATITDVTPGSNIFGVDPVLGALADNGGDTRTMRLSGASPAVDAGQAFGLTHDQRGRPRPFDIPSVVDLTGSDSSDMGAFELQAGALLLTGIAPVSPGSDTTPVLTGEAPDSVERVDLYDNAACTGTPLGSGTGREFTSTGIVATVPANATTTIYARGVDSGGFTVACTSGLRYVEDSTAPDVTGVSFAPASPANDNGPRLRGTTEAAATVKIYTDAGCTGPPAATGTGAAFGGAGIALPAVADDSTTSYYLTATDAPGNVSACLGPYTYVEDSAAPAVPALTGVTPAGPANDNTPRLQGTADAGSTIHVYPSAACTGTPLATGTAAELAGAGVQLPTVADNSTTSFYATATDAAGNTSACAGPVTYVEDSAAPAAPVLSGFATGSPSPETDPLLQGIAEAGATVAVYTSSSCTGTPVATGTAAELNGAGIQLPPVVAGSTTTFYVTATDTAGNVSHCAGPATYVQDASAPATPTLSGFAPGSPGADTTPRIRGTAETGTTVDVYTTADCSGPPVASGSAAAFNGTGIPLVVAPDTTTAFYVTATDGAGNVSGCAGPLSYTEDATAPAAPTLTAAVSPGPGQGGAPRVHGTAEAGSTVRLYDSAACTGTPLATGSAVDFASPGLAVSVAADDTVTLYATATDAAGNVSGCGGPLSYTNDATAPAAPTLSSFLPSSGANDNAPRIVGSAEAGATVRIYATADCSGAPLATGTAAQLAAPGLALAVPDDSETAFYATATDADGNVSACAGPLRYTEDSTTAVSGLATDPVSPANQNAARLLGTAEAGATVAIYTTADCSGPPVATGTAAEFASPGIAVPAVADDTTTSYRVRATDGAGNVSDCTGPIGYVEKSTAATPVFEGLNPASTDPSEPLVVGTAERGATVSIYATPDCTGTPLASGTGEEFSGAGIAVTVASDSATLYAAQTDALGNTSICSVALQYAKAPAATGPAGPAEPAAPAPVAPAVQPVVLTAPPVYLPLPRPVYDALCKRMPLLRRHTLKGATYILQREHCSHLPLVVKGKAKTGHPAKVTSQFPLPGGKVKSGRRITLRIR